MTAKKGNRREYSIPATHPRYRSLQLREAIADGIYSGLTAPEGLIAHGRGEAFDYLLGEVTHPPSRAAILAAGAALMLARQPVISVNGNVAALAPEHVVALAELIPAKLEVNIFHFSQERSSAIIKKLNGLGTTVVLGEHRDKSIPGLDHARARCSAQGIYSADVVLVPLEDGDRAQALRNMGKVVLTIDLNPLSRTSRICNITIVDNLVRALPLLAGSIKKLKSYDIKEVESIRDSFDNPNNLKEMLGIINDRLMSLDFQSGI